MKEKRRLDLKKIEHKISKDTISTKESLKDVSPIQWSKEVLSGEKEVVITKGGKKIV